MKNIIITLCIVALAFAAEGRQVSSAEAQAVAVDFFGAGSVGGVRKVKAKSGLAEPYYIYNNRQDSGFVIVSGDDRLPRILGYSTTGSFDSSDVPPQLAWMLEAFSATLSVMPEGVAHPTWLQAHAAVPSETILLKTAQWGQGEPYNTLLPELNGKKALTGCVATAMAIVMKYHNWPPKTKGHSLADYNYPDVIFDFGNCAFDWAVMDGTDAQAGVEISRLMLAAGVAANTRFGTDESGAQMWPVGHEFTEKFSYSPECRYVARSQYDDVSWNELLHSQLRDGNPVIYSGRTQTDTGHAFVIDGVDNNGLYHVNWGWDGALDGYFAIDALKPAPDMEEFGQDVGAVINIKPDESGAEYARPFIADVDVFSNSVIQWNDWNFSSSELIPGEAVEFFTPHIVLPSEVSSAFYIRIAVMNDKNEIVRLFGDPGYVIHEGSCDRPGTIYNPVITVPEEGLAPGERYQLVCKEAPGDENGPFKPDAWLDAEGFRILLGGERYPSFFTATGNRCEMVTVNWHHDSEFIVFEDEINTGGARPGGFTRRLKGNGCGRNIFFPTCGKFDFKVECRNADGSSVEPIINSMDEDYGFAFNISMYADIYDVYVDYTPATDTRHIPEGVAASDVVEDGGLVYVVREGTATLCGYTDADMPTVIIPETISAGGTDVPVAAVGANALVGHKAERLILGSNLRNISIYGLGWMENLRDLVMPESEFVEDPDNTRFSTYFNFRTNPANIFIPAGENISLIAWYMLTGCSWYDQAVNDVDIYLGEVGTEINVGYENDLYHTRLYRRLAELPRVDYIKEFNHHDVYIPGVNSYISTVADIEDRFSFHEMWKYGIDADEGTLSVVPVVDNVTIDRILVNGQPAQPVDGHEYAVDLTADVDVTVESTVNGVQKFSTHYTPAFNASIARTSGITSPAGASAAVVSGCNGRICIAGLQPGDDVKVYNVSGSLVYSGASYVITLPAGIYFVVLSDKTFKVGI